MTGQLSATKPLATTDSARTWIDDVARGLIAHAAERAPATLAARLEEEWLADSLARPGPLSRLSFAVGCLWAATVLRWDGDLLTAAATPSARVSTAMAAHGRYHGPRLFARRTITTPEAGPLCDINTTSLIDVMLVLLVTLIISLPLMTHAVTLDLPQAAPVASSLRPEVVDLVIDFDGTVVWNGATLASWQQLESHLRSEAQKTPQPLIHLLPERRVKYDVVTRVLAAAQRNRLQNIELVGTAQFED